MSRFDNVAAGSFRRGEMSEHRKVFYEERPEIPSSPEVIKLLDNYIFQEREKAEARKVEERKTLFYKLKKLFLLNEEENFYFHGRKATNPIIKMRRIFAEKDKILALVGEFDQWKNAHPGISDKDEIDVWKEFLGTYK